MMNHKSNFTFLISCSVAWGLLLGACRAPLTESEPILLQTPSIIATSIPSETVNVLVMPTLNNKYLIITPDALLSFPSLEAISTPNSDYFCEHIPSPQLVTSPDDITLLSGLFVLCPTISWPLVKTAMDLDTGQFVEANDQRADVSMDYSHPDLEGNTFYGVSGLNNAHIDEVEIKSLNYEYCNNLLQNKTNPGIFIVRESAIACVVTTEGYVGIIRVEHIFPSDTQSVEFSFALLKE